LSVVADLMITVFKLIFPDQNYHVIRLSFNFYYLSLLINSAVKLPSFRGIF